MKKFSCKSFLSPSYPQPTFIVMYKNTGGKQSLYTACNNYTFPTFTVKS